MTITANPPAPSTQGAPPAAPPAPTPHPKDDWTWDAEPGQEIPASPLFLVVIAEPGLGKTHLGCTFPGPIVCLDSEFRANEVLRRFRNIEKYWKKIDCFNDVRQAVGRAITKHKVPGTILFDSGSDLQLLAEAEVLDKIAGDGKKAHKTLHWGPVNKLFKNLFGFLRDRSWNAVFTARLKDEWKGEDRTGARVPGGFVTDKLIYHADFAIELAMKDGKRIGKVLKNGAKKPGTFAMEMPDEQLSYAGIVKAMEERPAQVLVQASPPAIAPVAVPTPAVQVVDFTEVERQRIPPITKALLSPIMVPAGVDWKRAEQVAAEGKALAAEIKAKVETTKAAAPTAPPATLPVTPPVPCATCGSLYHETNGHAQASPAPTVAEVKQALGTVAKADDATVIAALAPSASAAPPPSLGEQLDEMAADLPATADEISDLEELALSRWESGRDAFWSRLLTKGYATERGKLSTKNYQKLRALLTSRPAPVRQTAA